MLGGFLDLLIVFTTNWFPTKFFSITTQKKKANDFNNFAICDSD